MINIIVPMAGIKPLNEDSYMYPLPLVEVMGQPLIKYAMDNLNMLDGEKRFIFILNQSDCNKYHIDNTLRQLVDSASFIYLQNKTKGAVCSALMSIDTLQADAELLIVNSDQVIEINYNEVVEDFRQKKADGGVITFKSVHPRWSYARIEDGLIVETAEKNPISSNAIAGFYYFKKGQEFIDAAFQAILHDANYEGNYFTSSVYNEMILANKKIVNFSISSENYHSFYSQQKVREFENFLIS